MKKLSMALFVLFILSFLGFGCSKQIPIQTDTTIGVVRTTNNIYFHSDAYSQDEAISPDENFRVFIKDNPDRDICDETGCEWYNEFWISDIKNNTSSLLIASGDVSQYSFADSTKFPFGLIHSLRGPIFSLDGTRVYFLSYAWRTSLAVFSVDIATKELKFISDGSSLSIITKGQFRNLLVVSRHKYYDEGGSYDHYYIINDQGEEKKDLGEDLSNSIIEQLGLI